MAGASVFPRNDGNSVKRRKMTPVQAPAGTFDYRDITVSEKDKCSHRNSNPQSSQILSTTDLISAIGYAWDRARWPNSPPQSESNSTCKTKVVQGGDVVRYSTDSGTPNASNLAAEQPCSPYLNSKSHYVLQPRESLECSKASSQPGCNSFSFWRRVLARSAIIDYSSVTSCVSHTGVVPPNWGSTYSWMNQITLAKQQHQGNSIKVDSSSSSNICTNNCLTNSDSSRVCDSPTISQYNLTTEVSGSNPEADKPLDSSPGYMIAHTTTCSENDIVHRQHPEGTECSIFISSCDVSFPNTEVVLVDKDCENSMSRSRRLHQLHENRGIIFSEADSELKIGASPLVKPEYAFAKQEHAFAGALAGVFVSLCLHPIDTVKTVIQSCGSDQRPLHIIGSSIIAQRGILGLYRGISSNIVSSAPISAVYTYTYESVKKNLLPLLPKEYHSLAHCTAGGSASIATSFIFTPSERVKQQMQVGSHYRNCWNALINIVQNGGVSSLYAGWRAVLCRNIPHSVIKFYTYESLKQFMVPSSQSNALATLVCGGLAGSMASLFTTPFDVVKTRLQTQIPGSKNKYSGILNTLTEIWQHEGLTGLYRGLTPRLVMYMIQGALFFASYESFKRLFHLEAVSQAAVVHHEHDEDSLTTDCCS